MGSIPAVENLRLNINSSCCNGEKVDEKDKESPTPKEKSRKNGEKAIKNTEKSIEETVKEPTDENDIRSYIVRFLIIRHHYYAKLHEYFNAIWCTNAIH